MFSYMYSEEEQSALSERESQKWMLNCSKTLRYEWTVMMEEQQDLCSQSTVNREKSANSFGHSKESVF